MPSYEDAFQSSLDYFGGDELAAKVFLDKYALRDADGVLLEDTPRDMHVRIARELARVEERKFKNPISYEAILGSLDGFARIVPQGSPMYGIGNRFRHSTLSNCYVVESPLDSYGAIMKADEELVQISKRRGGVGIDVSHIRPAKTRTNNAARSSTGVVPFMQRFSNSIREVGQDGRRGALMLSISVHHPEVLEFAAAKKDLTKVTGANISVRLTDEFLNAVLNGVEYEQRWPVDSAAPKFRRMVDARTAWRTVIETAWETAEPGLLFWDNILRESPADCYPGFKTVSTNPCLKFDALLLTPDGIRKAGEVSEGGKVWSKDGWVTVLRKWSTGVNEVYKFETTSASFYGTDTHRIFSGGDLVTAADAEKIDVITGPYSSEVTIDPQDVMDGLVVGDGSVQHSSNGRVCLNIGGDDHDYFASEVAGLIFPKAASTKNYGYRVTTTILAGELPKTYERSIPDRFLKGGCDKVCGFLRGLYSANGSICGGRVTLKASSKKVIEGVQAMLSSVGIRSYFTTNKPTKIKFSNGVYECKQSYDLNITSDRDKFAATIGFIQEYKMHRLLDYMKKMRPLRQPKKASYDVVSVNLVSEEETFDIKVDGPSSSYWTQGCDVSNCSELPLSSFDSCRLLLLNLYSYVANPFRGDAYFDYDRFHADARVAQRYMDDIVDLELEAIDRILTKIESDPEPEIFKSVERGLWENIREACETGRRTGTGITGLGDALAAMGVKYGTDESIEVSEKIYRTLKLGCYRASVDMAKELGPFPAWDHSLEKDNPFLLRIRDEDPVLWEDMKRYGRRNIALLTTAPAGTVSIETRTSSGIEPVFMLSYTRRKKVNPSDVGSRVDFVDRNGDKWQEFTVYHPKVKDWMAVTGETDLSKSPWYGATAEEIDWRQRVKLQAAANRHVDHAISSTVNLPESASVEQVAEIYETAWKAGCKGITVYRNNCRTGVLVDSSAGKSETITKTKAPKRPKSLPAEVYSSTCGGEKYFVAVGMLDGEPYEVFAGRYALPRSVDGGTVVKRKRGHYDLVGGDDGLILGDITGYCCDDQEAILRMVSTGLRHGADVRFSAEQLEKVKGHLHNFARCLARVLKKYIPDGTEVSGTSCPQCGSKNVRRQEGCASCLDCGWSKC